MSGATATFSAAALSYPASRGVAVRVTDGNGRVAFGFTDVRVVNGTSGRYVNEVPSVNSGEPFRLGLNRVQGNSDRVNHWRIDWGDAFCLSGLFAMLSLGSTGRAATSAFDGYQSPVTGGGYISSKNNTNTDSQGRSYTGYRGLGVSGTLSGQPRTGNQFLYIESYQGAGRLPGRQLGRAGEPSGKLHCPD